MARATGVIFHEGGGFTSGWVGDLPIDEAVRVVTEGRLNLDSRLPPLAAGSQVACLLAGLGVGSIAEAHRLIERGRLISDATMAQFEELGRDVRGLSLPTGEVINPDAVLGRCPHGVDLDRAFCPEGCRV